jgi:hypothetical protein
MIGASQGRAVPTRPRLKCDRLCRQKSGPLRIPFRRSMRSLWKSLDALGLPGIRRLSYESQVSILGSQPISTSLRCGHQGWTRETWGITARSRKWAISNERRPCQEPFSFALGSIRAYFYAGASDAPWPDGQFPFSVDLFLFLRVHPIRSARVSSSTRCCPPTISSATVDHDELFELPPMGEAGNLINLPVTIVKDHSPLQVSPHEPHRSSVASGHDDRTLRNQSDRAT